MNYRVVDKIEQRVIYMTDGYREACETARGAMWRHPERDYTVIDDEGLDVMAREYD